MGKHGKRVSIDRNLDFEGNTDIFNNPELLDQYLSSIGVGNSTPTKQKTTFNIDSKSMKINEEDSEDVGAQIADMLMEKMGGSPRNRLNHAKPIPSVTANGWADDNEPKKSYNVKPVKNQKLRSNIALIRNINGVRHLSIRDSLGNAVSVPITSGETHIPQESIDSYLDLVYGYRKVTGMPYAVYEDIDELNKRFLQKNISSVPCEDDYVFATSESFENMILCFVLDKAEKEEFINYIKANMTAAEISDTMLSVVSSLQGASTLITNVGIADWYLETYSEKDSMKEALENLILSNQNVSPDYSWDVNVKTVDCDIRDYDNVIESGFISIGRLVSELSDKENFPETNPDEATDTDVETFDAYEYYTGDASDYDEPSNEEGKAEGASNDGETFPEPNNNVNAVGAIGISRENNASGRESINLSTGGTGINTDVCEDAQTGEAEEENEEIDVRTGRGYRGTSEFKETKEAEVPEGNGHTEIAEVEDPSSFKFDEEEKEESNSMVISVTTIERKK